MLKQLQQDSSLTNQQLADKVRLSPSACLRRVKALEDAGIIEGYHAQLNAKKLGLSLQAQVSVSMDKHTPERLGGFETAIANCEEVLECYLITGQSADYILKVVVKDMEHFQEFLLGKLTRIEGVTGVHSSFIMRKVVDRSALPLH
ncbi:MAG: Lrp/AsnC family transcriptional regulator [Venatoribacter sp.]